MLIASEHGSRTIFLTDEESDFLFLDLYLILSELESESSPYSSSSSSSSDSGPELSSVSRIKRIIHININQLVLPSERFSLCKERTWFSIIDFFPKLLLQMLHVNVSLERYVGQ